MTQAALIGQTFGMLSGNPRHLAIVQTFHGTIIAWARRQKMFDQTTAPIHSTGIAETEVESAWRRWVHSEEKKRVAVGLRIHDAELAELFMAEPFLRSSANTRLTVAHNDAWTAPTAKSWARVLRERDLTDSTYGTTSTDSSVMSSIIAVSPSFALYSLLEEKASYIMEHTQVHSPETQQQITQFLTSVYNEHLRHQTDSDPFSLKALWHSLFMSLYCDMNKIECAVGREGFEEAQNQAEYATIWASSAAGHRCAIHAALILKHLQRIPIGEEPAIHVPRLLYRASLIWYAYTRFGRDDYHGRQESSISAELEFPELTKAGIDGRRVLFAANGFKRTRPTTSESSTLFHLIDLLTRLGHWGISQKMASLFSVLIHDRPHYSES
ncbi:hypothetical protein BGW36DRAFT_137664 [Talaromyces proteolyticus]|uniref:Transcription factor domain-containing protein n=1 Tax=Talaromyces proteolyticus TaxID=1131652 RepID=A0AAD4KVR5_9EURO|nr:uncharacterized protein BGW36DRAFT_137664 [Talaromyces proteolyticus]KAH8700876.1 hypothetical protein BGW36DRAFT_137664 [Talaromyces proteolyticus]